MLKKASMGILRGVPSRGSHSDSVQCGIKIKLVIALAMMYLACQVREMVSLLALGHWSFPKKPGGTCSFVPVSFACHSLTRLSFLLCSGTFHIHPPSLKLPAPFH